MAQCEHPQTDGPAAPKQRPRRRFRSVYRNRNDDGFNILGFLIVMVATVVVGAIAWRPMSGVIQRARTTTVNANISTAAQTVLRLYDEDFNRFASVDQTNATTIAAGVPQNPVLRWLETESDSLRWSSVWAVNAEEAEPDLVRIQFIPDVTAATRAALVANGARPSGVIGQTASAATATAAPQVPWLAGNYRAARIRISDTSDNWACALIVFTPNFSDRYGAAVGVTSGQNNTDNSHVDPLTSGRVTSAFADAVDLDTAATMVKGIWFDSGDSITTNGLHDCSPVDVTDATDAATHHAELPDTGTGIWTLDRGGASTDPDATLTRQRPTS